MVAFTVPGEPMGKGRPRITTVNGFARAFTPAKTRGYEALIALAAEQAMQGMAPYPRETALVCEVEAVFPVPASWSKRKRQEALMGLRRPIRKPDGDNIIKTLDALNGVVWTDDASVVEWTIRKSYGEVPHLVVNVRAA